MLNQKHEGQVFTPTIIVDHMLEMIEYYDDNIYTKKIMEPSFGDGAFLTAIISKIIQEVKNPDEIKKIIQQNVFGVEQDKELYQITIKKLNQLLRQHNVFDVHLEHNLICGDTLKLYKEFQSQFDIVIGNPPLSINQQLCKKDRHTSINHKKQLHTHLYYGGVVVS